MLSKPSVSPGTNSTAAGENEDDDSSTVEVTAAAATDGEGGHTIAASRLAGQYRASVPRRHATINNPHSNNICFSQLR